jgi:hypothetical protein
LNGYSAYAEAPNSAELAVVGNWTVEAWFKDETTGSNGNFGGNWSGTQQQGSYNHAPTTILSKGDLATDKEVPLAIGITANSLYIAQKSNGAIAYMYYDLAAHRVSANSWHHVAVTMKASTRQATVYLDGVQVMQGSLTAVTTVGNSKPVSIGRNGGPSGAAYWRGKLDDVRVWSSTRTAAQISANFRTQLADGQQPGLIANWRFDEGSGTTAADMAGASAQNATLSGGATWSTDVHP